jgi:hypothetical protein
LVAIGFTYVSVDHAATLAVATILRIDTLERTIMHRVTPLLKDTIHQKGGVGVGSTKPSSSCQIKLNS